MEPRASYMLTTHYTTELYSQPFSRFLLRIENYCVPSSTLQGHSLVGEDTELRLAPTLKGHRGNRDGRC
jgi:hypothetical protein